MDTRVSWDEYFMNIARVVATRATCDRKHVGAVVVREDRILASGYNLRESRQDPTAHAELIAIRKAALKAKAWRLTGATLYVTLEPCPMCMGAIILARIPTVVFGCYDPKGGAAGSLYDLSNDPRLNHSVELVPQVLEADCSGQLSSFFAALRARKKAAAPR